MDRSTLSGSWRCRPQAARSDYYNGNNGHRNSIVTPSWRWLLLLAAAVAAVTTTVTTTVIVSIDTSRDLKVPGRSLAWCVDEVSRLLV